MTDDQFKMICIHELESETYCVYIESMPGLIVQVDNLCDAPKELAKSFEVLLKYGFDKGNYDTYKTVIDSKNK